MVQASGGGAAADGAEIDLREEFFGRESLAVALSQDRIDELIRALGSRDWLGGEKKVALC